MISIFLSIALTSSVCSTTSSISVAYLSDISLYFTHPCGFLKFITGLLFSLFFRSIGILSVTITARWSVSFLVTTPFVLNIANGVIFLFVSTSNFLTHFFMFSDTMHRSRTEPFLVPGSILVETFGSFTRVTIPPSSFNQLTSSFLPMVGLVVSGLLKSPIRVTASPLSRMLSTFAVSCAHTDCTFSTFDLDSTSR